MSLSDLDMLLDPAFSHENSAYVREQLSRRHLLCPPTVSPPPGSPPPAHLHRGSDLGSQAHARSQISSQDVLDAPNIASDRPSPYSAPTIRAGVAIDSSQPSRRVSRRSFLEPPPTSPPPGSPPPVPINRSTATLRPLSPETATASDFTYSNSANDPDARERLQISEQLYLNPPTPARSLPHPTDRARQSSITLPRPLRPTLKIQTTDIPRATNDTPRKPKKKTRFLDAVSSLSSSSGSNTATSSSTLQGSGTPPSTSKFKQQCTSRGPTPHPDHVQQPRRDSRRLSFFPTPITPLSRLRFPRSFAGLKRLLSREWRLFPRLLRRRDRFLLIFIAAMVVLFSVLIGVTAGRRDVMCKPGNEWVMEGLNAFGPSLVVGGPYTLLVVGLAVSRWGRREIAGGVEHAASVEEARARRCCDGEEGEEGGVGEGGVERERWWKRVGRKCWSQRGGGRYTGVLYAVAVTLIRVAVSALMANLEWKIVDCGSLAGTE